MKTLNPPNTGDPREPSRPVPRAQQGAAGQKAAQNSERSMIESLLYNAGIVWKHRLLVIAMSVIGAVGSVGFAVLSLVLPPEHSPLPNRYLATATLLLQRGTNESVTAGMLASLGLDLGGAGTGFDYGQIAMEVLQNRSFIDKIVEDNDVIEVYSIEEKFKTASRKAVLDNMSNSFDDRTGILTIGYEHIDPEYAAQVTQSMVDELLSWFAARGGSDRLVAVQTMEEKLTEVEDQIKALESQIEEFQRTYGILRVEEIAQTQSDLLAQFQAQLLDLDLQISNVRESSNIENDPALLALESQRRNILALMQRIEEGYTGTNDLLPPRDQLPGLAAEYTRLQMNLEIQQRIYEALTEQYEIAKLTADTDPAFAVLEPVEVPEEKSGPSRGVLCVGITMASFIGSILIALLLTSIQKIAADPSKRRFLREGAA